MHFVKALVTSVVLLGSVRVISGRNRYQVTLAVYYESRSTKSKDFIMEQVLPAAYALQQYLSLRLIPFGNARFVSKTKIKCKHGEAECKTNMLHECTLHMMEEAGRSNVERAEFVACEMAAKVASTYYMSVCTKMNNSLIHECAKSPRQGLMMQKISKYLTKLLPRPSFPAVTINGVYNEFLDKRAKKDLIRTLCTVAKMPPCTGYPEEPTVTSETSPDINHEEEDLYLNDY